MIRWYLHSLCARSCPATRNPATLEWHGWTEARHCQLIINTLSANFLHSTALSLPVCVCVCVGGGGVCVCVARGRKMPPRSVALPGDYSCLRGSCTEPQRGKCLETGINLFNLALFCPLLHVVCPSQVQPSTCRDTTFFFLLFVYFRFTSAFLFFSFSLSHRQVPHVCLYCLCVCVYTALPALWQHCDRNILLLGQRTSQADPPFLSPSLCTLTYSQSRFTAHLTLLAPCVLHRRGLMW